MDRKKSKVMEAIKSNIKNECSCPPSRLCPCAASIPKPPPSPSRVSTFATPTADATSPKPTWASPTLPGGARQVYREGYEKEFFRELLGNNCCPDAQEEEVFESDEGDEDEDSELQSATGTVPCEEVEERQRQEDLDALLCKFEEMSTEKVFLEQDKQQLVCEKLDQERELLEANNYIKVLEMKMGALVEQQKKEMANAKAANKILREKMESVQDECREKETRRQMLEQTIYQGKEIQERLQRENEDLEAEVDRLTKALDSVSKSENSTRMGHGTRSEPGGLAFLEQKWECSTCTYHNSEANLICDMCRYYLC